jgi:hypothetical protein
LFNDFFAMRLWSFGESHQGPISHSKATANRFQRRAVTGTFIKQIGNVSQKGVAIVYVFVPLQGL